MLKKILLLVIIICIAGSVQSQIFPKVPKQYSLEFGYRNLFSQSNFNNQITHGYGMLFDYAWQLSGFDGTKAKSYISVPMGYTILLPDNPTFERVTMLNYGWNVRHELKKNQDARFMPFVGYGLYLNDLTVKGTEGSVFGHQTQFDFGIDLKTSSRLKYFVKIQYSYTSYPQFNEPERIRLHYADLRIGARF